jgi:hypothetical protein
MINKLMWDQNNYDKKAKQMTARRKEAFPFCEYLLYMLAVLEYNFCLFLQLQSMKEVSQPEIYFLSKIMKYRREERSSAQSLQ